MITLKDKVWLKIRPKFTEEDMKKITKAWAGVLINDKKIKDKKLLKKLQRAIEKSNE